MDFPYINNPYSYHGGIGPLQAAYTEEALDHVVEDTQVGSHERLQHGS
jgi:hypothetical protein